MSIPVLSDKDKSILNQVAFKAAVDLLPADYREALISDPDKYRPVFADLIDICVEELYRIHNGTPVGVETGVAAVATAFPGAAFEPPAAPQLAPVIPITQPAFQAPAPAHPSQYAADPVEAHWQSVVTELQNGGLRSWFDNRYDKRNPKAPDFKAKNTGPVGEDGRPVALWIKDKTTPAWVKQVLV